MSEKQKATLKMIGTQSVKALFVNVMILMIIALASLPVEWVISSSAAMSLRHGLFVIYEFVAILFQLSATFGSFVQSTQINNSNQSKTSPQKPDSIDKWFQACLMLAIVSPFMYYLTYSNMYDTKQMGACLIGQWAFKFLLFVMFPRQVVTVAA